jgi:hypothetical protein
LVMMVPSTARAAADEMAELSFPAPEKL